jgi:hypothetical protein
MMAAFSRDIGSAGKFSFFHCAIMASVVRTLRGSIPSVIGIFYSVISGNHLVFQSSVRNLAEKAPI